MSSINSITYNDGSTSGQAGVYAPGDPIQQTVNYIADTPSVTSQVFTATTTITDAAGTVTTSEPSTFTVNTPQPNGDVVATTDSGDRTWTPGTTTPQSDGSLTVTLSTTA